MSPLEEALFRFLMDRRYAVGDPEYPDLCRSAQGREERLRSALPPEQARALEDLLLALQLKAGAELEAMFASALRLGLELARL